MKRALFVASLVILCSVLLGNLRAEQNPLATPSFFTVAASVLHTNCPAPISGQTSYCFAGDGLWVALNGTAYAQLGSTGVSSVSVNGGTPQTGAVIIKVPTTVTGTWTGTIQ